MEDFLYESMRKLEKEHFWFSGRRIIIDSLLRKYINNRNGLLEILEVGCGTGGNLEMLSEYGNVYAMELDDNARFSSQEKVRDSSIKIYKGSLPYDIHSEIRSRKFDLIVLFDVLEHIEDDLNALLKLHSLLKKDGYLFITVPALPFLWSEHDKRHHHYRRYNKSGLQIVAKRARFEIIKLTYFNFFLFPAIFVIRIKNKIIKTTYNDLVQPMPLLNHLLMFIFASERFFIKLFPFPVGASLFLIAQSSSRIVQNGMTMRSDNVNMLKFQSR